MPPIPGLGRPRPDVQGHERRHPPAQPRPPPARPRRERPAPGGPPADLRLRRRRVRRGRGLAETRQLVQDALPHYPALRGVPSALGPGRCGAAGSWRRCRDQLSGYTSGLLQQRRRGDPDVVQGRLGRRVIGHAGHRPAHRHRDRGVGGGRQRATRSSAPGVSPSTSADGSSSTPRSGSRVARTSGRWGTARPCPTRRPRGGSTRPPASMPSARPAHCVGLDRR